MYISLLILLPACPAMNCVPSARPLCQAALPWRQPTVDWNLCRLWAKINVSSCDLWAVGIVFQPWESKTECLLTGVRFAIMSSICGDGKTILNIECTLSGTKNINCKAFENWVVFTSFLSLFFFFYKDANFGNRQTSGNNFLCPFLVTELYSVSCVFIF